MDVMTSRCLLALGALSLLGACKTYDPLYCDGRTACTDPERPYCDLEGTYPGSDGVARTCIPSPFDAGVACDPDSFLGCDGTARARYCPEAGVGEEAKDCTAVCSESAGGCACECPAGPEGPPGTGIDQCEWLAIPCSPGPDECQVICPKGKLVFAGGCDMSNGGTINESRPGAAGPQPSPWDRWVCQAATGDVQGTYALCCPAQDNALTQLHRGMLTPRSARSVAPHGSRSKRAR
jgi:hypothetical protein